MNYLVSVVVPTKNRYRYLKYLIKLIDGFQLPELELVIQDNSDDNSEILKYLKEFDNTNIKYFYSSDKLTMSGNADTAVQKATGEYVCFIGDDDGVCRGIVNVAKWLKENDLDGAFHSGKLAWYHWRGELKLLKKTGKNKIYQGEQELGKLPKKGFILSDVKMPIFYHAMIKRSVLERIYSDYGTLFLSVPPDISSAIVIAKYIGRYCETATPIVINGSSKETGGGVQKEGGVIPLERVSFITQDIIDNWEPTIPKIWVGAYAWAQAGIKTLKAIHGENLISDFNLDYCLAHAVALRPRKKELWKYAFQYSSYKTKMLIRIIVSIIRFNYEKLRDNMPLFVYKRTSVNSIIEAESFISQHSNFKH